jgi:hypothetical protein
VQRQEGLVGAERSEKTAGQRHPQTSDHPVDVEVDPEKMEPERRDADAVLWAGLMLGFFFLLHIGEYAHTGVWDMSKVLTPKHIRPQKGATGPELQGGGRDRVVFQGLKG